MSDGAPRSLEFPAHDIAADVYLAPGAVVLGTVSNRVRIERLVPRGRAGRHRVDSDRPPNQYPGSLRAPRRPRISLHTRRPRYGSGTARLCTGPRSRTTS